MTALDQYDRLECQGVWKAGDGAQRTDVIVALGKASLVITDKGDRVVDHWSLPAVVRRNPGEDPALYASGQDAPEVLELDDSYMVDAIERVLSAVDQRRARPGRLRRGLVLSFVAVVLAIAIFWLPGAMIRYTAAVVPEATRAQIGQDVLSGISRVVGRECRAPGLDPAMARIRTRLGLTPNARIAVIPGGAAMGLTLPGDLFAMHHSLVEDHETPEVLAGYLLDAKARAEVNDPLQALLRQAGVGPVFKLLTTGALPPETIAAYAEAILTKPHAPASTDTLIQGFADARVSARPYAYARDISGEATLDLIETDPHSGGTDPAILSDADWVRLQGICGP